MSHYRPVDLATGNLGVCAGMFFCWGTWLYWVLWLVVMFAGYCSLTNAFRYRRRRRNG